MLGWECPKCGSCYSPSVQKCSYCPASNLPYVPYDPNTGAPVPLPSIVITCGKPDEHS